MTPAANLTVSPGDDGEVQSEVSTKRGNGWKTLASDAFRDPARDLLPLPLLEEFVVDDGLLCRSVKRRLLKCQKLVRLTNETVRALNSLYGADCVPTRCLSEAQRVGQHCHFQARQRMGTPPADPYGKAALGELLAMPTCFGEAGMMANLGNDRARFARPPEGGSAPPPLSALLGKEARHIFDVFVSDHTLAGEERAHWDEVRVTRPHWDPVLAFNCEAYVNMVVDF